MDLGNLIGMLAATELVEVDGLTIGYHRAGFGPALVLLHGYVGDGLATWRPQIEGLSDELTVIAWDAPGAGRSSDPPDQFGMAGYADCLRTVIDRLGLDRPHVAGLWFGGALAIEFSRRHPAIPRSLILASVYAGLAGSLPDRCRRPAAQPGNCAGRPVIGRVRGHAAADHVHRAHAGPVPATRDADRRWFTAAAWAVGSGRAESDRTSEDHRHMSA